ncbi:MAG: type II toxin-antitoxin system VapC family toxin [Geminicoccaceae bacterium]
MVVDTSAVVAILVGEPDAETIAEDISEAPARLISAVTRVELSFVIEGRKGELGRQDLDRLLASGSFEIVSVTPHHADLAIEAFGRYGEGRHPAGLNIGDCFSYALSMASGLPLLFKGVDCARTDVRTAMPSDKGML